MLLVLLGVTISFLTSDLRPNGMGLGVLKGLQSRSMFEDLFGVEIILCLTGVDESVTSKERFGLFKNCDGLNGSCLIGVFFRGVFGSALGATIVKDSVTICKCCKLFITSV